MTLKRHEQRRLHALHETGLLDTPPEERFDRLTRIAKQHYQVDTTLFTLIDAKRQWFKSKQNLGMDTTPRRHAFCTHTIQQNSIYIVEDAANDPLFYKNPLVTSAPFIRFYAGIPLRDPTGFKIGTLCLIDSAPRDASHMDFSILRSLAAILEEELEREHLNAANQEKKRLLSEAINIDSLTKLPNRHLLNELFQDELNAARDRRGSLSVCFLDLDGFKAINDLKGHAIGDEVLRCVADRLRSAVRHHDVTARLSGDEFVIILRDVEHARIYRHILDQLRHPMHLQGHVIELSASMGITRFPSDDSDSDLLLRHADQAMYTAKETGKNCYHFFDLESHHSQQERFAIGEQVQHALDNDQLELFYQPQLHYKTGIVSGFECLIRWHHPSGKLVYPGRFLPYIEHTKLDIELGKQVINQAVSTLETFQVRDLPYTISINLSPSHFLNDEFLDHLNNTLSRYDMAFRKRLTLEILESTALDDAGLAASNIKACQALGVQLSLDDFGTGYASLSYLRKFSTNEIKIDRSFILGMLDDPEDEMIVEAIVALSKSFNRRVIAEGIEDRATEEKLIAMGCDIGQGFFYSPALPLDEALDWADCYARP
ncbi:EAL domain-containing protein [Chromohalobacter sarecensis]|uniref:EAL domain-containing protein n=1 Tax=Chromohalobacter sarecensis TaxID=245294 RepID=A0ABV9D133_9GAMM|nr:GGDEF domain-containing protein [Chromohalobacter sarecensis]MCK0713641.1 GGDEF domain-containing protein [Chromohalobacter sarecensis]